MEKCDLINKKVKISQKMLDICPLRIYNCPISNNLEQREVILCKKEISKLLIDLLLSSPNYLNGSVTLK